jgi:hypothetical protein
MRLVRRLLWPSLNLRTDDKMMSQEFFNEITGINTGNPLLDETIFNYLVHRLPPGSFTTALLENDLYRASTSADHTNIEFLGHIARNVAMNMPLESCGSRKAVQDWLGNADGRQAAYAEWYFEQATMRKLEKFD